MGILEKELEVLQDSTRKAGLEVMRIAADGFATRRKANQDPVTAADGAANHILKDALLGQFPDTGWLSEETVDDLSRLGKGRVWIVDPIDGTKEFIEGIAEFAVSVALVEDGLPIAACVFNPSLGDLYLAASGRGAWRNNAPIRAEHKLQDRPIFLASRSEIRRGEFRQFESPAEVRPCGSIAYKLALVAEGKADATFSLSPKNEWDIVAGVLLVQEAGGKVSSISVDARQVQQVSDCTYRQFTFNRRNTLVDGILAGSVAGYDRALSMIQARTRPS